MIGLCGEPAIEATASPPGHSGEPAADAGARILLRSALDDMDLAYALLLEAYWDGVVSQFEALAILDVLDG